MSTVNVSTEQLLTESLKVVVNDHSFSLFTVLIACMSTVEKYAQLNGKMSGADKQKFALDLVPLATRLCVNLNLVSLAQANEVCDWIEANHELVVQIMEVTVWIAKSPTVLQLKQLVESKCMSLKCCLKNK